MRFRLALLVVAGAWGQGIPLRNVEPAQRAAASGKPWPVQFEDVSRAAGIVDRFISGEAARKKYIIEANGAGVAFLDFDNDGWQDVFLINSSRLGGFGKNAVPTNRLYRNRQNGTFEDVTRTAGLAKSGWGNGVCVGDIDNDGNEDLLVTYWGTNVLYRNTGKGDFEDYTSKAGLPVTGREWGSGCSFFDYDHDGHLDLFIANYLDFDPKKVPLPGKAANCEWKGMPVFCGPRGLPYGKARLYRNRGDATFEDVTASSGIGAAKDFYAFTVVAADLTGDGWTDLYVACDATPSLFFRNNKDGTFSEIAAEAGVAFNEHGQEQSGMGVAVGDYDNNGTLDLIKTNFTNDYPNLYRNEGGGLFEDVVLRAGLGVNPQHVAWGVGFVDFDNDGWKDLFQVNGHLFPELEQKPGGEPYESPRLVYRNLGHGKFEDVSPKLPHASSRGAAFGDFDNDGAMDVLIQNMGELPTLLKNNLSGNNRWIKIRLQGTKSNRSAIGAVVTVIAGELTQTDMVTSQSSYLSHNDRRLHFGLGQEAGASRVNVRWPGGDVEEFGPVKAGLTVTLVEGKGARP